MEQFELVIHNGDKGVSFIGSSEEHIKALRKMADDIENGYDGGENWFITELSEDEINANDIGL